MQLGDWQKVADALYERTDPEISEKAESPIR